MCTDQNHWTECLRSEVLMSLKWENFFNIPAKTRIWWSQQFHRKYLVSIWFLADAMYEGDFLKASFDISGCYVYEDMHRKTIYEECIWRLMTTFSNLTILLPTSETHTQLLNFNITYFAS